MRHTLKEHEIGFDPHFRYRGKNQTRVEAFSDAAFALAITLVVLSSTVPKTFDELWISLREVIPFGFCVLLVFTIWYQHYIFFLRYGLQNFRIVSLNVLLIFLLLVYVYPLKFLFMIIFEIYAGLIFQDRSVFQYLFTEVIRLEDTSALMIIYGSGGTLIFGTLMLMYRHALSKRDELDLNKYEVSITKMGLRSNLFGALIPLLSVLVAISGWFGQHNFTVAGFIYMFYPPVMIIHGKWSDKKNAKLAKELNLS